MKRNILDRIFGIEWLNESEFLPTNLFVNFLCRMAVKRGDFISDKPYIYRVAK